MPDPLEPLNRGVWGVNHALLTSIFQPTSRAYRTVVQPPVRKSINQFARNLAYPGRVLNNMFQGRWKGAGDETLRFLTNTTVGVAGFFDPATKWNIPKSEANFGQTFSSWGWKPHSFAMLPILGPSDDSHAFGKLGDFAVEPLTWAGTPYTYGTYATNYNRISDSTETAAEFIKSSPDPYTDSKVLWTYAAKETQPDWRTTAPKDMPTLETLGVALMHTTDPRFGEYATEKSVRLSTTGRSGKYSYWLQKGAAPLAYISPGLGSHRLSGVTVALAEMLFREGFSVVTISGVFNYEFIEQASSVALPGYPPQDCQDLLQMLTDIDQSLAKKYPGRFGKKALIGFSMGGYQALYLAAREKLAKPESVHFDRYLAIDVPVDLQYSAKVIDKLNTVPAKWPANERQFRADNAVHKAAALAVMPPEMLSNPPIDGNESKFLVGLSFRLTLRDVIYIAQKRNNMGVIQTPISSWRRTDLYNEIMGYSILDYVHNFVFPYFDKRGVSRSAFVRELNLRTYTSQLRNKKNVRIIVNRNDFLLPPKDEQWLRATFSPSQLAIMPTGGHLGNLTTEPVRQQIAAAMRELK